MMGRATLAGIGLALLQFTSVVWGQVGDSALVDALKRCDAAPGKTLAVDLDVPYVVANEDYVSYESWATLNVGSSLIRDSSPLHAQVWVNGSLQVNIGQELKSYPGAETSGSTVKVRFVLRKPGTELLTAQGDKVIQLQPDIKNVLTVLLAQEPASPVATEAPPLACGSRRYEVETKAVDTFAVAVGFNYTGSPHELNFGQNDAEAIVKHYVSNLKVDPKNIWLVTDDANAVANTGAPINIANDTTAQGIDDLIESIALRAAPGSTFYFYYSGHMVVRNGTPPGTYFFLPTSELSRGSTQLNRQIFLHKLMQIPMAGTIVMLDACFSGDGNVTVAFPSNGPMRSKSWQVPTVNIAAAPADSARADGATVALFSSGSTSPSWELDEFKHGVFTYYLLHAGDETPQISVGAAYTKARESMKTIQPTHWEGKPFSQTPDNQVEHNGDDLWWKRP